MIAANILAWVFPGVGSRSIVVMHPRFLVQLNSAILALSAAAIIFRTLSADGVLWDVWRYIAYGGILLAATRLETPLFQTFGWGLQPIFNSITPLTFLASSIFFFAGAEHLVQTMHRFNVEKIIIWLAFCLVAISGFASVLGTKGGPGSSLSAMYIMLAAGVVYIFAWLSLFGASRLIGGLLFEPFKWLLISLGVFTLVFLTSPYFVYQGWLAVGPASLMAYTIGYLISDLILFYAALRFQHALARHGTAPHAHAYHI